MTYFQKPHPEGVKPIEQGRFFDPGYDGIVRFDVKTDEWEHICSARFGEGRPCGWPLTDTTKWTGDSYRYDIYRKVVEKKWSSPDFNPPIRYQYALRWWNGGGEGWLIGNDEERRDLRCVSKAAEWADLWALSQRK
jgi:hypothetical protein